MRLALSPPRLALLGLAGLVVLSAVLRSQPGSILALGDVFFVEPRPSSVERELYLWTDGNGGTLSGSAFLLPYRVLWAMAGAVGIAPWLFQSFERATYLLGALLAMALLARAVWPGRPWAPVFAAAFYTFNVARLQMELVVHLEWLYVLLPLLLWLLIRLTQHLYAGALVRAARRGLALAVLIGLVFPIVTINLPQAIVVAVFVTAAAAAGLLLAPWPARRRVLVGYLALASLTVLLSAWWLWPLYHYYVLSLPEATVAAVVDPVSWAWTQERSSLLNELLLTPQWNWSPEHVPVYDLYQQPLWQALLLLPGLAALGAWWAARGPAERRRSLALLTGLLLLLFLGKGQHEPGSYLNQLALLYVPGLWLLREPWGKIVFLVVLAIGLLAGLALDELVAGLRRSVKVPLVRALLAGLLLLVFPMTVLPLFARSRVYAGTSVLPSPQVRLPAAWYDVAKALDADTENSRILLAPGIVFYSVPYVWGGYFADALPDRLLPQPVLNRDFGYLKLNPGYSDLVDAIYQVLDSPEPAAVPIEALALLNVRYVLVRGDMTPQVLPFGSPIADPRSAVVAARLSVTPGLEPVESFGALQLFRLSDAYYLPRVYSPTYLAVVADADDLVALAAVQRPSTSAYLTPSEASRTRLAPAPTCQPQLAFEQVSPVEYHVQASGDCGEYVLILSSGYDPNWQVSTLPPASAPVNLVSHFRANGYANGWHVQANGPHSLRLYYRPQRLFVIGLWLSAITLGAGVLWLLLPATHSRRTLTARPGEAVAHA